jgi:GDP/UDP-N,N'-diacetylbacillosamine 2-epimerase (hydrolysing)
MQKICIFTGTRAEYGLLKPLMVEIQKDSNLKLQTLVSGMHLSPEFGLTFKLIEENGFDIDEKVEILMSSDSPVGICKSVGLGMIGYSEALQRLSPEILVILGDRFEAFAAATASIIQRIPLAHLHGGEATYGLIDESIRHSITKMSQLHFTSTEEYRQRVIQLGEHPDRVFNVGALGVENIHRLNLLSKKSLEKEIGFVLSDKCILVTFHPVTLETGTAEKQFKNILEAIDSIEGLRSIFTKANADTESRIINSMIDGFVAKNSHKSIAFTSMGQLKYLSTMKHVNAVVGNSSSAIIEAPSFKVPTVNIGDRQKGRIKAKSIIECESTTESISEALKKALSPELKKKFKDLSNPYEKKNTSKSIKNILKFFDLNGILKKEFYDLPLEMP